MCILTTATNPLCRSSLPATDPTMQDLFPLIAMSACFLASMTTAPATTEWQLTMPPDGKPVSAVFICPRWGDGAKMAGLVQKSLGAKLGVATLLTRDDVNTFKEEEFLTSIPRTLSASATDLKHPELANAPLLLWAHSNAAAFLQGCLKAMPKRVVAYCLFKSAFGQNNDFGTLSQDALDAFGQSIWDENDRIGRGYDQQREKQLMLTNVTAARKQGALIHVTLVRGTHHVIDGQEQLMLGFFETAMAMRIPANANPAKGPVKLIGGLEKSGWVQDIPSKLIYAFTGYPAASDPRQGWWLPTRAYAAEWNKYALNAKGTLAVP